ncbi:MAG TPA: Fe-S cluster assembly protein SufD [Nevskiaceae bacterium]|nr:Fe-S cluster assembly protein SufD [Nevskiaceae bacterium]
MGLPLDHWPVLAGREAWRSRWIAEGFPRDDHEAFHYTDLSDLDSRHWPLAGPLPVDGPETLPGLAPWPLEALAAPGLAEDWAFAALNASYAGQGLQLQLAADQRLGWRQAGLRTPAGQQLHFQHRLRLGARAEAQVLIDHQGGAGGLSSHWLEIQLDDGAQLTLVRVQDDAADHQHLALTRVQLGRDSRLHLITLDRGQGRARHDLQVRLAGRGAEAQLDGLYLPAGRQHLDTQLSVQHQAEHTRSRQFHRGIAADRGVAVFNGQVRVHRGARGSDSDQKMAHLLLGPAARVNAKPELVIDHDEVKCAHGASTGQLDAAALHYLRSRGLAQSEARALLVAAFAGTVLERLPLEALRRREQQVLLQRLGAAAPLEMLALEEALA